MNPLFILPFDHRGSFARDLLGTTYPLNRNDKKKLVECKTVIFDAILYAKAHYKGDGVLATIIDEELGTPVIRQAKKKGVPIALTTETTNHDMFAFIHGAGFDAALKRIQPAFAKALVYYTPGNEAINSLQRTRIRRLSDFCIQNELPMMLEVLVGEMEESEKEKNIIAMMEEMQDDGIQPAIWKIEGLATAEAWERVATHTDAQLIILGRGASEQQVDAWVKAAANSRKVSGFAVGRTVFLRPIQAYASGTATRKKTVETIGKNYLRYIKLWEKEAR